MKKLIYILFFILIYQDLSAQSCDTVSNIHVVSVQGTEAMLSWSAVPNAVSYEVFHVPSGSGSWGNSVHTITPGITLSNLTPNTTYFVGIYTHCNGVGNYSSFAIASFQTTCDIPAGLNAQVISGNQLELGWNPVSSAVHYSVQYRDQYTSAWTTAYTSQNQLTLNHLQSNTGYEWSVMAVCSSSNTFIPHISSLPASSFIQTGVCGYANNVWCNNTQWTSGTGTLHTTVSWNKGGGFTLNPFDYEQVEYKKMNEPSWLGSVPLYWTYAAPGTPASQTIAGLLPENIYQFRIKTFCNSQFYYSAPINLNLDTCSPPVNLNVPSGSLTCQSAVVQWNYTSIYPYYQTQIQYKRDIPGDTTWINAVVNQGSVSAGTSSLSNLLMQTPYRVRVRRLCGGPVNSPWIETTFITSGLPIMTAPSNVQTTNKHHTWIRISWYPVSGANGYTYQYRMAGTTIWDTVNFQVNLPSTVYFDTLRNLVAGTSYEFRIRSKGICGSVSNWSTLNTNTYCPQATGLNTIPGSITASGATLYWNAAGIGSKYIIQRTSPGMLQNIDSTLLTQYSLSNLNDSTEYTYRIITRCAGGVAEYCVPLTQTTFKTLCADICSPPDGLISSAPMQTSFYANWNTVAGAQGYQLEYKKHTDSLWNNTIPLPSNTGATYSYPIPSLEPGTWYHWRVSTKCYRCNALSTGAASVPSDGFTSCPAPTNPLIPSSGLGYNTATISWTGTSYAHSYLITYRISGTNNTWDSVWVTHPVAQVSLGGLQPGTNYNYKIQTKCLGSVITFSSSALSGNFNTKCPPPSNLIAFSSNNAVLLQWTPYPGISTHKVEYKNGSGSFGSWNTAANSINGSTYTLTGFTGPSTSISVRIGSNCNTGSGSGNQIVLNNILLGCYPPTTIQVSVNADNIATVYWPGIPGAIAYKVEYKTSSGNDWIPVTTQDTFRIINGLQNNMNYQVRVYTRCFDEDWSDDETNTTFTTICARNAYIQTEKGATQAVCKWSNQAGIYGYSLRIKTATSISWSNPVYKSAGDTSYIFNSLLPNTIYYVALRTRCSSNSQDTSQWRIDTFQTYNYCSPPTNLQALATALGTHSAQIRWSPVPGAGVQSYTLRYRYSSSMSWDSITNITDTFRNLNSLLPSKTYTVSVRTLCGALNPSTNYATISFNTHPCDSMSGYFKTKPINLGTLSTTWISNTQTNSQANCFYNTFYGTTNQSAGDIWYRFTLSSTDTVEIRQCNSAYHNTVVHLLDSNGTEIAFNDQGGPLCPGSNKGSLRIFLNAGTYYIVSECNGSAFGSITTEVRRRNPMQTRLQLRLFIEGYYTQNQLMTPALSNQASAGGTIPGSVAPDDVDDMEVELHPAATPSITAGTATGRLKTQGYLSIDYPVTNGLYYVVVKHRNAIQTWSSIPLALSEGTFSYHFNLQSSQAYGQNQKEIEPGIWALYSGDINQDENVDLQDGVVLDQDILQGNYGYQSTDLNGDGNVDLLDEGLYFNNQQQYIYAIHP